MPNLAAKLLAGAIGCLTIMSPHATAQATTTGPLDLRSNAGQQTSVAIGWRSYAVNDASVVREGVRAGSISSVTNVGSQTSVTLGGHNRAQTMIGTATSGRMGNVSMRGNARSLSAISLGVGSSSCVAVASAGGNVGSARVSASVGNVVSYDIGWISRRRVLIGTVGRPC